MCVYLIWNNCKNMWKEADMKGKINERIKLIRKHLDISQEKFGEKLGIKKSAVSKLELGENSLSDAMAKSICREYNVNAYWLETGEGEMFIEPSTDNMDFTEELLKPENEEYLNFFKECMNEFTKEDWEDIKRLMGKVHKISKRLEDKD